MLVNRFTNESFFNTSQRIVDLLAKTDVNLSAASIQGVIGDLYFDTASTFAQGTSRMLALRNYITHPEHQQLCAGFFQDMTDRFAAGLLENFDAARSAINREASRSLAPSIKQPALQERKLSWWDRIRGKTLA